MASQLAFMMIEYIRRERRRAARRQARRSRLDPRGQPGDGGDRRCDRQQGQPRVPHLLQGAVRPQPRPGTAGPPPAVTASVGRSGSPGTVMRRDKSDTTGKRPASAHGWAGCWWSRTIRSWRSRSRPRCSTSARPKSSSAPALRARWTRSSKAGRRDRARRPPGRPRRRLGARRTGRPARPRSPRTSSSRPARRRTFPPDIAEMGPVFEKPYDPAQLAEVLLSGAKRGLFARLRERSSARLISIDRACRRLPSPGKQARYRPRPTPAMPARCLRCRNPKKKGLRSRAEAFRDRITSRLDGRGGLGGDISTMSGPDEWFPARQNFFAIAFQACASAARPCGGSCRAIRPPEPVRAAARS